MCLQNVSFSVALRLQVGTQLSPSPSPSSSRTQRSEDPGSESQGLSIRGQCSTVCGSPIPARASLGRDDDGNFVKVET